MEERCKAIREHEGGVEVRIRVAPRSSRRGCSGYAGERVKFNLHSAPVEDAANHELVELLAKELKVTRGSVRILKGGKSRDKIVRIDDVNKADLEAAFPVIAER
jgi:uncharacterized protein (TIGR00251 family)